MSSAKTGQAEFTQSLRRRQKKKYQKREGRGGESFADGAQGKEPSRFVLLEGDAQSELQDARRGTTEGAGGEDLSESTAVVVDVDVGNDKFRMIEEIEYFYAEFEIDAFGDGSGFGNSHVHVGFVRSAEIVADKAVGALRRIANRVECWRASVKEIAGETIGIEIKISGDRRGNTTNVFDDGGGFSRIEILDRSDKLSVGEERVAGARSARVGGIVSICKPRGNVEREAGTPGNDGIYTPTVGETLGPGIPNGIEGKIPATTKNDTVANVAVARGVKIIGKIGGNGGVALVKARGVIDVVGVGIGEREIGGADARVFHLAGKTEFEAVVVSMRDVSELGNGREAAGGSVAGSAGGIAWREIENAVGGTEDHGIDVLERSQFVRGASDVIG